MGFVFLKASEGRAADGDSRDGGSYFHCFLCLRLLIKERDYTLLRQFIVSVSKKRHENGSQLESLTKRKKKKNLLGCYCMVSLVSMRCLQCEGARQACQESEPDKNEPDESVKREDGM